jgi:hypothetical protein
VRKISPPVLPIPPVTASIRTRIKELSEHDETVLKVVGRHLGSLASLETLPNASGQETLMTGTTGQTENAASPPSARRGGQAP